MNIWNIASLQKLQQNVYLYKYIRILNLSRVQRTKSSETYNASLAT